MGRLVSLLRLIGAIMLEATRNPYPGYLSNEEIDRSLRDRRPT